MESLHTLFGNLLSSFTSNPNTGQLRVFAMSSDHTNKVSHPKPKLPGKLHQACLVPIILTYVEMCHLMATIGFAPGTPCPQTRI
jgi:hypothetical protein